LERQQEKALYQYRGELDFFNKTQSSIERLIGELLTAVNRQMLPNNPSEELEAILGQLVAMQRQNEQPVFSPMHLRIQLQAQGEIELRLAEIAKFLGFGRSEPGPGPRNDGNNANADADID